MHFIYSLSSCMVIQRTLSIFLIVTLFFIRYLDPWARNSGLFQLQISYFYWKYKKLKVFPKNGQHGYFSSLSKKKKMVLGQKLCVQAYRVWFFSPFADTKFFIPIIHQKKFFLQQYEKISAIKSPPLSDFKKNIWKSFQFTWSQFPSLF